MNWIIVNKIVGLLFWPAVIIFAIESLPSGTIKRSDSVYAGLIVVMCIVCHVRGYYTGRRRGIGNLDD